MSTIAYLEARIKTINEIQEVSGAMYTKTPDGKLQANVGMYYLESAYGGFRLSMVQNDSGGCVPVLGSDYTSKKDLAHRIDAYIHGLLDKNI